MSRDRGMAHPHSSRTPFHDTDKLLTLGQVNPLRRLLINFLAVRVVASQTVKGAEANAIRQANLGREPGTNSVRGGGIGQHRSTCPPCRADKYLRPPRIGNGVRGHRHEQVASYGGGTRLPNTACGRTRIALMGSLQRT
jgi:hypothetical protein